MKALKIVAILLVVYAGVVVVFESLLGYFQPAGQGTLVITTTGSDGDVSDRVLSRIESQDKIYVSVNHWPRDWYRRALANPSVEVTLDGEKAPYVAVPVGAEEHGILDEAFPQGMVFRILTGFPPRHFVRLEPR